MYHNQKLIKRIVKNINKESEKKRAEIINDLKSFYESALDEQKHINEYTAPEEIESRNQAVYYYEDIFKELGVNYVKH